jgi:hypothetical protein
MMEVTSDCSSDELLPIAEVIGISFMDGDARWVDVQTIG